MDALAIEQSQAQSFSPTFSCTLRQGSICQILAGGSNIPLFLPLSFPSRPLPSLSYSFDIFFSFAVRWGARTLSPPPPLATPVWRHVWVVLHCILFFAWTLIVVESVAPLPPYSNDAPARTGHVTSSTTRPLCSPYAICFRCSTAGSVHV